MPGALAYAETRDGTTGKASREAMGVARALADELGGGAHAIALGPGGTGDAVAPLAEVGADRIFVHESPDLELYQPDVAAGAVARRVREGGYEAVVFAATAQGKDLAPRVAARLGRELATEIVGWSIEDGVVRVERPMYAGKAIATLEFGGAPALLTIRPNVFPPEARDGAGERATLELDGAEPRVRVIAMERGDRDRVDVGEARIVVSGGRGMQGPEHWGLLEDLVEALGDEAALGASRAVVDAGWRPHAEQVGQTGKTVAPSLYFAIGISGAIQHLAGMRTAKVIVAINRDADAPIFDVADYGIVGDAFEILPPLTEAIRELRGTG